MPMDVPVPQVPTLDVPIGKIPIGRVRRRDLLLGTASFALAACGLTGSPHAQSATQYELRGHPPEPVTPGPWRYFTPEEGEAVEALVDRLIPPDPVTPGGKDASVAVFIDRQLSGPFGHSQGLYMRPPFADGTPEQGPQSPMVPATRYRLSLAALDRYCKATFAGKSFAELPDDRKDDLLRGLERNTIQFDQVSGKAFFEILLKNAKEGFFADPLYGGNRDLVAWKMIGFPGARYDYRDWVDHHNERYPLPPVGILGRSA